MDQTWLWLVQVRLRFEFMSRLCSVLALGDVLGSGPDFAVILLPCHFPQFLRRAFCGRRSPFLWLMALRLGSVLGVSFDASVCRLMTYVGPSAGPAPRSFSQWETSQAWCLQSRYLRFPKVFGILSTAQTWSWPGCRLERLWALRAFRLNAQRMRGVRWHRSLDAS